MQIKFIVTILFVLIATKSFGQIPVNPNKTDASGKKQGPWTIRYNTKWKETSIPDSIAFYRVIDYSDNAPKGLTHDYYKSGVLQWEGTIVQENPDIFDGYVKAFGPDGFLTELSFYKNGKFDEDKTIEGYMDYASELKAKDLPDLKRYLDYIDNWATKLMLRSDLKSLQFRLETVSVQKQLHGIESIDYALALSDLGRNYTYFGDYVKAEPAIRESVRILASITGKSGQDYGYAISMYASLYFELGDIRRALQLTKQVVEIGEKSDVEIQWKIRSTENLGALSVKLKDNSGAEKYFLKSLSYMKGIPKGQEEEYAHVMSNLAYTYMEEGKYFSADTAFRRTIRLYQDYARKGGVDYLRLLSSYAKLNDLSGHDKIAEEYFKKSYTTSPSLSASFKNREADFYLDRNQLSKADSLFRQAEKVILTHVSDFFGVMSEQQRENYFQDKVSGFIEDFNNYSIRAYSSNATMSGEMYDLQLALKAILLNSSAKWKQRIRTSGDVKLFNLYQEWETISRQLAKEVGRPVTPAIEAMRFKSEDLEKTLIKRSALFAKAVDKKSYSWKDVQQALKPNEAAVEIIRFRKRGVTKILTDSSDVRLKKYKRYGLTDTIYYAALIVKPGLKSPILKVIRNGNDLDGKFLNNYQNSIRTKQDDKLSYDQYWKELAKELKSATKIYFSGDGVYHRINLNTLKNPATGRYLIDEANIKLVTNTKDILQSVAEVSNNKYALLVARPDYGLTPQQQSQTAARTSQLQNSGLVASLERGGSFTDLPGTQTEVEKIADLLKEREWQVDLLIKENALEQSIKDSFKPSILHIATHGFFRPEQKEGGFQDNPLLQSGLILAGAAGKHDSTNLTTDTQPPEDGILTAYEAMNLNLDNTEVVVLSACETGLGEMKNGQGVYGLQRAFKIAGAKSIIMSLWKVDDITTQALMVSFYQKWLSGGTKSQAFQAAQLAVRSKSPEPYYWGAFVIIGED